MSTSGGSGGPLTDRTAVSYSNGVKTSTYHIYAAGLDWTKSVGLLVYGDGSGEFGLANPTNTYLMAGTNGLIAVAKKHNMVLVTPRAPGNGCTDGDGVCWYLGSVDGTTRAQKTKWLDDLIKTQVLPLYNIDKTRAVVAGFSSGAENAAGIYGPLYAASWMEDGLLLAISYGSSPGQFGITDTYTASFRANVAAVWDVRGADETTAVADSLDGYNWYVADGFATTVRNVIPGGQHDRPGEFGGIVDQYVTAHVAPAASSPAIPAGSGGRTNLAPNPALKVNATGWSAVDNTGATLSSWARSTAVGAALPRATGFEGTQAGDVLTPRAAVTAGQSYYWAVSVRATGGALSANMLVNYYAALSGGAFISNSGATVPLDLTSGSTARFVIGPYTPPAGAVSGYLKLNDLDAGCEITAYQVELASTYAGDYFDGDTAGAAWGGAPGNSTSSFRPLTEPVAIADSFGRTATAVGPVTSEPVAVGESWTMSSTGLLRESLSFRESFLIASLEWDPVRGRNRVSAFGFGTEVVQARVSRRPVVGGTWQLVRGGAVDVTNGLMTRRVDDYEFPSGIDLEYRIDGVTGAAAGALVVQTATVRRASVADSAWLKFITQPSMNRRLDFMGRTDISRDSRTAVYPVQGRPDPVVVTDVHASRQFTITVKTETLADADALDHALSQGLPCYLQIPVHLNCPTVYAVVGAYSFAPPALKSQRNIFTIPLIEVSAPPASVVSPNATWQQLLNLYSSWEALMSAVPTWLSTAD
jgi:hypothetical protein